jgi:catechol 2,3-dioxygenase-like lactoylglutathione lyase family enzyme
MFGRIIFLTLLVTSNIGNLFGESEAAVSNPLGIEYLSHVGVAVSNLETALHFYRDLLGLPEAFRVKGPDGSTLWVMLRINDNNFVELFQAKGTQPQSATKQTSVLHWGIYVKNLQATLHALQARGYALPADAFKQAAEVRRDGSVLCFIKDPDGNPIEVGQVTPGSLQAKSRRAKSGKR